MLDHPDAPWRPPAELPHPADLRRGVQLLEEQLRGVDKKHAAYCLAKLAAGFNERLSDSEAEMRLGVWLEACGALPNDLWSAGVLELLQTWKRDAHYGRIPEAADLLDVVKVRLERRQRDLQRTQAMLRKANAAAEAALPETERIRREPPVTRLKRILREQSEAPDVSDADRLFNMANTERALAFAMRRRMEPWAQQFFDDRVPKDGRSIGSQARTIVARTSPTDQRLAELATAKHTGAPAPEHRDVPEDVSRETGVGS